MTVCSLKYRDRLQLGRKGKEEREQLEIQVDLQTAKLGKGTR